MFFALFASSQPSAAFTPFTSSYARPRDSPQLHHRAWPLNSLCAAGGNCSEQVSLALGGEREVVISFAAPTLQTPSEVTYWATADPSAAQTVTGYGDLYSSLNCFSSSVYDPSMGVPTLSLEEVLEYFNTSAWAFEAFYGIESGAYRDPDPKGGVPAVPGTPSTCASFDNPRGGVYTSPVLHHVSLPNLTPGASYTYHVANDLRNFTFSVPAAGADVYPFMLGLTVDIGITAVSELNMRHLIGMMEASENSIA